MKKYNSSEFIPVANILFNPKKKMIMFHTLNWKKKWNKVLVKLLTKFIINGINLDTDMNRGK